MGVLFLIAAAAPADWNPGDPSKWVQLPDLAETGMDVLAVMPYLVADDFECTETGPITEIHVWSSWRHDEIPFMDMPEGVAFTLTIYEDIPDTLSPNGYSEPGDELWIKIYPAYSPEFTARVYASELQEGFMIPPDNYEFPGDWTCWQYNFDINLIEAFQQQGSPDNPIVYWLSVQAMPEEGDRWFGVKTSLDHWNDGATWGMSSTPPVAVWNELIYPPGHEWHTERIALAFVIVGETELDLDWGDAPDPTYPTIAASTGASHQIITGVHMGVSVDGEADGQPDPNALGDDNDGNDDEDGVALGAPFRPGTTATVDITVSQDGYIDAWFDWNADGSWAGEQALTSHYLAAGTTTVPINVPASAAPGRTTFARFRYSLNGGLTEYGYAPDGEVEDYEILIGEGEGYKWLQRPDLDTTGIDVHAVTPFILADDWLCTEPGRVDEIHIWGSWLGDYLPFGIDGDPLAVEFTLSIHKDIPAEESETGYSMPGDVLWIHQFPGGQFDAQIEAWGIEEGWLEPPELYQFPADWTCWHYTFTLAQDEAFHQTGTPDEPIVYWLDLQAEPHDPEARFGWKTSIDHWNDDAVWAIGMEPYFGSWIELIYPEGHPWYPQSIDLAFALKSNYGSGVDDSEIPLRSGLGQNVPNPFNPKTSIAYDVPAGGCRVAIDILDVSGRVVRHLVDEFQGEGRRETIWDGRDDDGHELSSGVYFYKLVTPKSEATRKMLLLK